VVHKAALDNATTYTVYYMRWLMSKLGRAVVIWRARNGLSQADVAKASLLSIGFIGRLERGETKVIRPSELISLAHVMGITENEARELLPDPTTKAEWIKIN
jgi:transcriptional regulator with XRE-family HTH domain